ncbi:hypothetical protein QVD99_002014 [Batrachochytrium dendrobatidis]|nr:hypothetical protein O5D80_000656 [Batrachochytrium dendrobatidis]KAK5672211.1 hypothetical protein QVD99_002014 [Batrachochytrium dendrobatidis]
MTDHLTPTSQPFTADLLSNTTNSNTTNPLLPQPPSTSLQLQQLQMQHQLMLQHRPLQHTQHEQFPFSTDALVNRWLTIDSHAPTPGNGAAHETNALFNTFGMDFLPRSNSSLLPNVPQPDLKQTIPSVPIQQLHQQLVQEQQHQLMHYQSPSNEFSLSTDDPAVDSVALTTGSGTMSLAIPTNVNAGRRRSTGVLSTSTYSYAASDTGSLSPHPSHNNFGAASPLASPMPSPLMGGVVDAFSQVRLPSQHQDMHDRETTFNGVLSQTDHLNMQLHQQQQQQLFGSTLNPHRSIYGDLGSIMSSFNSTLAGNPTKTAEPEIESGNAGAHNLDGFNRNTATSLQMDLLGAGWSPAASNMGHTDVANNEMVTNNSIYNINTSSLNNGNGGSLGRPTSALGIASPSSAYHHQSMVDGSNHNTSHLTIPGIPTITPPSPRLPGTDLLIGSNASSGGPMRSNSSRKRRPSTSSATGSTTRSHYGSPQQNHCSSSVGSVSGFGTSPTVSSNQGNSKSPTTSNHVIPSVFISGVASNDTTCFEKTSVPISAAKNNNSKVSNPALSHLASPKERPFACTYTDCTATFTRMYNLKSHLLTHTKEKPHACPFACGVSFGRRHDLQRHLRTLHSPDRPFQCPFESCGYAFRRMNAFQKHLVEVHPERHGEGGSDGEHAIILQSAMDQIANGGVHGHSNSNKSNNATVARALSIKSTGSTGSQRVISSKGSNKKMAPHPTPTTSIQSTMFSGFFANGTDPRRNSIDDSLLPLDSTSSHTIHSSTPFTQPHQQHYLQQQHLTAPMMGHRRRVSTGSPVCFGSDALTMDGMRSFDANRNQHLNVMTMPDPSGTILHHASLTPNSPFSIGSYPQRDGLHPGVASMGSHISNGCEVGHNGFLGMARSGLEGLYTSPMKECDSPLPMHTNTAVNASAFLGFNLPNGASPSHGGYTRGFSNDSSVQQNGSIQ